MPSTLATLLQEKAAERSINLANASDSEKLVVYQATIVAMEELLDTSDRTEFVTASLARIRRALLDLISGLREVKDSDHLTSQDRVLSYLRKARDQLDVAQDLLNNGKKGNPFYGKLTKAQECLAQAAKSFTKA